MPVIGAGRDRRGCGVAVALVTLFDEHGSRALRAIAGCGPERCMAAFESDVWVQRPRIKPHFGAVVRFLCLRNDSVAVWLAPTTTHFGQNRP